MHTAAVRRGVPRARACENLALHFTPSRTGYSRVACSVRPWWGTKEKGMSYARTHGTSHIQEAWYRGRGALRVSRRENVCARSAIVAGPITFAHLIGRRCVQRASIDSERRRKAEQAARTGIIAPSSVWGGWMGYGKQLFYSPYFCGTSSLPALIHRIPPPPTLAQAQPHPRENSRRMSVSSLELLFRAIESPSEARIQNIPNSELCR